MDDVAGSDICIRRNGVLLATVCWGSLRPDFTGHVLIRLRKRVYKEKDLLYIMRKIEEERQKHYK